MPVTTESVPHLREAGVAEPKRTAEKAQPPDPAPKLARASESGDPAVQWLLAEQATWGSVGNTEKVAELEQRLADLGFTSQ